MKSRAIYKALDFAVIRAPLLPIEDWVELAEHNNNGLEPTFQEEVFSRNADIRRALLIGSSSLYSALQRTLTSDRKAAGRTQKLLRYLIRMSTRPTPYGLFAGVGILPLGDKSSVFLNTGRNFRARPDAAWLNALVRNLESRSEVRKCLRFSLNPALVVREDRLKTLDLAPQSSGAKNVSVRITPVVKRILELARSPVAWARMAEDLLQASPQATEEKITKLLTTLWENGFLISELRYPLSGEPAKWLLERLREIDIAQEEVSALSRTLDELTRLEHISTSDFGPAYGDLSSRMNASTRTSFDPPIQIDSYIDAHGCLHREIGTRAAQAAELLLRLSPFPDGSMSMAAYRREFVARYGLDREVPLLDLMDPESGLPYGFNRGQHRNVVGPSKLVLRNETLLEIAHTAVRTRQRVVHLDETLLSKLQTSGPDLDQTPFSLDLSVIVVASSSAHVDFGDYDLVVSPITGGNSAGKMLGRFADMLGPVGIDALRRIATAEEQLKPDCIWAELAYYPQNARSANVVVRPNVRQFEIAAGIAPALSGCLSIRLEELMVGVRNDRFYVRWVRRNCNVIVSSTNMLNTARASPICRFLIESSHDGLTQLSPFDWGPASTVPFLPRVQVGRIVLRPAQWRIPSSISSRVVEQPGVAMEVISSWRDLWDVPRDVYLSAGDNRLLLDLQNAQHCDQLKYELRHRSPSNSVVIQEALPSANQCWVPGVDGRFAAEFVVPLVRRSNAVVRASTSSVPNQEVTIVQPTSSPSMDIHRVYPPGTEWLFLKLYIPSLRENEFISGVFRNFISNIDADVVDSWFYVRYFDPEPHIRIRFHGNPPDLIRQLLPEVCVWCEDLIREHMCSKFAVDTYEPEVARYGGSELLESVAHPIFAADSQCAVDLVRAIFDLNADPILTAIASTDDLLLSLGLSQSDILAWLRRVGSPGRSQTGDEFRQRKTALRVMLAIPEWLEAQSGGEAIARALSIRRKRIQGVCESLPSYVKSRSISCNLDAIYRSIVHMQANRLGRTNDVFEQRVLGLLHRTRESLHQAPLKRKILTD